MLLWFFSFLKKKKRRISLAVLTCIPFPLCTAPPGLPDSSSPMALIPPVCPHLPHPQSLSIPCASGMKNTKWVKLRSLGIALEIRPQLSGQARVLVSESELPGANARPLPCEDG